MRRKTVTAVYFSRFLHDDISQIQKTPEEFPPESVRLRGREDFPAMRDARSESAGESGVPKRAQRIHMPC